MRINPGARGRAVLVFLVLPFLLTGCEILSGDSPAFRFDATIAGMQWHGKAGSSMSAEGALFVWATRGEVAGGNYERISLSIPDFDGVGAYKIGERHASYEEVVGGDGVITYGDSAAAPDDRVTITRYDASTGIVRGEFSFEAIARQPFNGVAEGESFSVSGTFEAQVQ